jgi:predicted HicB family RNase H-like nuclease
LEALLDKGLRALQEIGMTVSLKTMEVIFMAQQKRPNAFSIRIPEITKAEIKQAAKEQGISPNKFAHNALQAAVRAAKAEN